MSNTPITLYVVFHPDSRECSELANHLHDWFRLKTDEGAGTEAGLPIWFRSALSTEGVPRLTPKIEFGHAQLNILIVLVDDLMVQDEQWRSAIRTLCADVPATAKILPAGVDTSAFRLDFLFKTRNALDAGKPAPDSDVTARPAGQLPPQTEQRIADRSRVLRRAITEAIARELHAPRITATDLPPPPLDVFLSHAKRDGREVAAELRSGLADFSQLKSWFDEDELPAGYGWSETIESAAGQATSALISVVTDAYSSRPWCRREVNFARWPRRLKEHEKPEANDAWKEDNVVIFTVQPAVAVSLGAGQWSRPMSQLSQVPHMSWPVAPFADDEEAPAARLRHAEHIKRRIADIVDRLLLETLMATFYRRIAEILKQTFEPRNNQRLALVTWVPDPWSLVHLRGKLQTVPFDGDWILAYPGHGLRYEEQAELHALLSSMEAEPTGKEPRFKLMIQEQLGFNQQAQQDLERKLTSESVIVGLSGGGSDHDVNRAGIGAKHVSEMMVRLTRRLVEVGIQVRYGGTLSNPRENLTRVLIDVAKGWDRVSSQQRKNSTDTPQLTPLVNYAAWPFYGDIQPRQRARLTGICQFINVNPDGSSTPLLEPANSPAKGTRDYAVRLADALSAMRSLSASACHVRVVLAGKIDGWQGWLPGILEEVMATIEHKRVPLIIGGFGGCAQMIARYLA